VNSFEKAYARIIGEVGVKRVPVGILRLFYQAGRDSINEEAATPGRMLMNENVDEVEHGVTNTRFYGFARPATKTRVDRRRGN
jgi:hypothetical protein